ncbi:DUF2812 domain-containing protein [Vagococcus carniphilus]|uniref:DUF2812 domain-containing protein n=1 Tax=Vagococcus carniphilus TaxID=218144 RepID=UPI003BA9AE16
MKIGNKKIIYSKGLAFYAELEGQRLAKELAEGWEIESINWFGFYKLKPVPKENCQVTIDFYPGKKADIPEYLEIYEAAGWEEITRYRNRYFIFKGPKEIESVYTDEESFSTRIKREHTWVLLNSFIPFLIGLLAILILKNPLFTSFFGKHVGLSFSVNAVVLFTLMFPISCILAIVYYKSIYLKRSSYFKQPQKFAIKQRFKRDVVLSLTLGGVVGGIIGFVFGYFNLF